MSLVIRSMADLQRANIELAWSFSRTMTEAQVAQLVRVSDGLLMDEPPDEARLAVGYGT